MSRTGFLGGIASAPAEAAGTQAEAKIWLGRAARVGWPEILFWLLPVLAFFLLPDRLPLMSEIAILSLFALSLDLILGYAGIVSLGHAAFFGLGAYTAGLLARHGWSEPLSGLALATAAAGLLGFLSSFLVLRGSDLTRLMVTLGVAMVLAELANKMAWLTGGADGLVGMEVGPILGLFEFDIFGRTGFVYATVVLFLLFCVARYLVHTVFGLTLRGIKGNRLRMEAIGAPVSRNLIAVYTLAAAYAGAAGALLAQTTQFVSLDVLEFHRSAEVLLVLIIGGTGYLYGGLVGAVLFRVAQDWLTGFTQQYWLFWLGLILVVLVLVSREGLKGLFDLARRRLQRGAGP
ncbi:branched-chain amino acid ABC transporter permease [Benzoatithermus flavus]|uniref:Branched-chain amino acid ABC transporter permease n=1 Tax=Benzoatithermus flavus TaxID=3108223 RepID=A0ABU8XUM6_9PROT